jgi:predicted esterase
VVTAHPRLRLRDADGRPRAVALVLHGGRAVSIEPARPWRLAAVRMWPFGRTLRTVPGLSVGLLGYRYRGWNDEAAHPLDDVAWALDNVHDRYGDVPVLLVGHSMGGRAALRAAGHRAVVGVAALAPWLPADEPVDQLAGRSVLIAHGEDDRMTDPRLSYSYAVRARATAANVCRFEVSGDGHAMMRRAGDWHRLVRAFAAGVLKIEPLDAFLAEAMRAPIPDGIRVALPHAVR